eukprot:CAMPEP_0173175902 /NCGR_PEP_ID=MMETSP1141-20130122/4165_1 /TAXON_ID=483371 /ORGANISM="non described non described, Strain CCMP2298" /LENGTH=86 /DNA_ID=CAMNT_0014098187 /DNA_START=1508 /DNA_END=1768 /DNA_ORIENTATION=+
MPTSSAAMSWFQLWYDPAMLLRMCAVIMGTICVRSANMCVCTCGDTSQLMVGPAIATLCSPNRLLNRPSHSPPALSTRGPRTPWFM